MIGFAWDGGIVGCGVESGRTMNRYVPVEKGVRGSIWGGYAEWNLAGVVFRRGVAASES